MVIIDNENFEKEVINSDKPTLVDFFAEWCGPCKMLSPEVESLETEIGDKVKFCKLNVDNAVDIAIKYGVEVIPTLILFDGGNLVKRTVGYYKKDEIKKNFDF